MTGDDRNTDELTPFDYEVLALVGRGGAAPHDLLLMARRGRIFAWAGESQYYVAPKRLAARGYLSARKEPGRTHPRTVYALTEQGLAALRAWAQTPVSFPRLRHEGLVRLLAADLVGEQVVLASLATLRDDIADLSARLAEGEAAAADLPHRQAYLLLGNRLARRLLDVHLQWLDEVERELTA